jgi:hypothetical protein
MTVSDIFITSRPDGSKKEFAESRGSAAHGATDWLSFAAAPTFAMMALLTAFGGGQQDMICTAMLHVSPLSGMVPMYLLMSAFHLAPWLKLFGAGGWATRSAIESCKRRGRWSPLPTFGLRGDQGRTSDN